MTSKLSDHQSQVIEAIASHPVIDFLQDWKNAEKNRNDIEWWRHNEKFRNFEQYAKGLNLKESTILELWHLVWGYEDEIAKLKEKVTHLESALPKD